MRLIELSVACSVTLIVAGSALVSHAADVEKKTIHSQPSLVVRSSTMEVAVTETGGHMSPVVFYRDTDKPVQPYYISPWQDEPAKEMPAPVLVPLRGDFFCMPFGGNSDELNGEKHPPHGEIVGAKWSSAGTTSSNGVTTLTMTIDTGVRKGRLTKQLSLVDGQNVVYTRHVIEGFSGRAPLGHHATLAMPDEEGQVRIATSPIRFGMTYPGLFSDPKLGEYQALLPGTKWMSLAQVPKAWKGEPDADLTRLPGRTGFADLIQIFPQPAARQGEPAWVTATFAKQGYLWFSMKDPAVLKSTVFWMENRGRHGHPWNGRNNCLGLEDVTAYFADGLAASAKENLLTREGVTTALELSADRPTAIHYIQGVVKVPQKFDVVKTIEFAPGTATFVAESGAKVTASVRHEFIGSGKL